MRLEQKRVKEDLAALGIEYPPCGFYIGEGWYAPVMAALAMMILAGWDRRLAQVKQKFGGLRLYIEEASDEVNEIVCVTEELCNTLCENCGAPHGLTIPLSGSALCPKCSSERIWP